MGYEYDSKVNRDLARTAMSIYTNSHNIKPLNESAEFINEEALRENVNALILNYVSDVIVLAESHLGREMTDAEINESSMEVLNRIDSISPNEKAQFVQQLAEAAAPSVVGGVGFGSSSSGSGTNNSMGTAPGGAASAPSRGNRGNRKPSNLTTAGRGRGTRPGVQGGRGPQTGGPFTNPNAGNQFGQAGSPGSVAPGRPSGPNVGVEDPANQLGQGPGSPGSVAPGRPTSGGNQFGAGPGSPGTVAPGRPTSGGNQFGAGPGSPGTQAPGRPGAGGGPSVGAGPGSPGTVAPSRPTSGGEVPPFDVNDFLPGGSQFGGQGGASGQNSAIDNLFNIYGSGAGAYLSQLLSHPNFQSLTASGGF